MNRTGAWLRRAYRFLDRHLFYSALLSSGLSVAIFAGRVRLSGEYTYGFMIWNLILAWVPYVCSLWATFVERRYPWWGLLIPGFAWLVFLPNAPYMVTDFLHLSHRPPIPVWFDSVMLTSFAWTGCFLAVISLRAMQSIVEARVGRALGWLFALGALFLSGLGIYLGRALNWNSWDIILNPHGVLTDVLAPLLNPLGNMRALGMMFSFAAFLSVFYVAFLSAHKRSRA